MHCRVAWIVQCGFFLSFSFLWFLPSFIPSFLPLVLAKSFLSGFRIRLYQPSASTLRQLCRGVSDSILIENNGVAPDWGYNPRSWVTPLFSMRTESLTSSQCFHSIDADARCNRSRTHLMGMARSEISSLIMTLMEVISVQFCDILHKLKTKYRENSQYFAQQTVADVVLFSVRDIINDIEQLYGNSDFLRKGNVFSRVCPSAILSTAGSHVTVIHDLLDLTVQGRLASTPSPRYGTSLYRDP